MLSKLREKSYMRGFFGSIIYGSNMTVSENDGRTTCVGFLGKSFLHLLRKTIGEKKVNKLFLDVTLGKMVFYSFYKPEVIAVLNAMMKDKYGRPGLNIKNIQSAIDQMLPKVSDVSKYNIDYSRIEKVMQFKIMDHQKPIFDRYEEFKTFYNYRGMLLDAGPGTGKTFSSLALAEGLNSDRVYIICPLPTVDDVWRSSLGGSGCVYKEPQKFFHVGRDKEYNGEKFIIMHYEAIGKGLEIFKNLNHGLKQITVIIDESHNLASSITKRTTDTIEFINTVKADDVFALSGTPIKSGFKELGVIFKLLDSRFTGQVEKKFYEIFKSPNKLLSQLLTERYQGISVQVSKDTLKLDQPIVNYVKVSVPDANLYTLDYIKGELEKFITVRSKELEAMKGQIEKTYNQLKTKGLSLLGKSVTTKEIAEYEANVRTIKTWKGLYYEIAHILQDANKFENKITAVLQGQDKKDWREYKTMYKYPALKIQGEALGKIITGARIKCHASMAKELDYKEIADSALKKTLIFGSYINVCETAVEKCKQQGYRPLTVFGGSTGELERTVNRFTNEESANPLIATYKSLSVGVRLTAANVVVCLDLPFRMYVYDQAISRVWRLGQDQQVYIYILSLDTGDKPNINSRNIDIIKFFKEEVERITGAKASLDLDENTTSVGVESIDYVTSNMLQDYKAGNESLETLPHTDTKTYGIFSRW